MTTHRLIMNSALAASIVLLLAGCFFGPSAPQTGGGTGGNGQTGQTDDSETQPGDDTGTGDMFQGVPATFPSDVPLIAGDVPIGVDLGTGWTVVVKVADVEASYAEASELLKGAGFEVLLENSNAEGSFGAFESPAYQVQVTGGDTPDYGLTISYLVVKKE